MRVKGSRVTWRFMGSYNSRVISTLMRVISTFPPRITPLITTHEPPSIGVLVMETHAVFSRSMVPSLPAE